MSSNEWLQSLKVGDEVYLPAAYGRGGEIYAITRVTQSQICIGGYKFWKKNGRSIGTDSWCSRSIRPVTIEMLEEIEALIRRIECAVNQANWPKNKGKLEEVIKAISPYLPEPPK